ncbi:hypothetical protein ABL78_4741 [Leptomonas seymouri]|uniref:Uncharacterized protein n=1 Tax=Leptomonas seymouri TaxID=5684 RepID=A0A0N1I4G5_LEPSE|nr:hypothetical protein ABL78_4741 [Leptomonas seymouri]|eukprot:KPI86188.1 hypothetical protein ABL78_4741 [Leptomonas seymouri]
MASRSSRESLKRKREEYQLSVHQYVNVKRQRCNGTEGTHHASVASYSTEELQAPTYTSAQHHEAHTGATLGAPSFAAAATDQRAAALASRTSGACLYSKGGGLRVCAADGLPPVVPASGEADSYNPIFAAGINEMVLRLRPIRIAVVRGDTGRRCSFYLQPTFSYSWHRDKPLYHSLDGEQVGLELQETVLCVVSPVLDAHPQHQAFPFSLAASSWPQRDATMGASVGYSDKFDRPSYGDYHSPTCQNNEETAAAAPLPSSSNALFFSPSYAYEATQRSRRLSPPTYPSEQSRDILSHLGSCSPALFVDCLLKCVHDEALLPDDHGWVCVYHGRHILADIGRTRLLQDLFGHAYFPAAASERGVQPTLTMCVLRKY